MSKKSQKVKPIETVYNGYRFRSRLEARWAVFFDALGVKWEYEPEGYDLGDAGWYLPDFWIHDIESWIEVKPTELSDIEKSKCFHLAEGLGYTVIAVEGPPGYSPNDLYDSTVLICPSPTYSLSTYHGYNIPNKKHFPFDYFITELNFVGDDSTNPNLYDFLKEMGCDVVAPNMLSIKEQIISYTESDKKYYYNKYGKEHPHRQYGINFKSLQFYLNKNGLLYVDSIGRPLCIHVLKSLDLAKTTRFEHGEQPAFRK